MSKKNTLMERMDEAAIALLDRYFPKDGTLVVCEPQDQIRAFQAVVSYYNPRLKLGGEEDERKSEFEDLQRKLKRTTTKRHRNNNGTGVEFLPADTFDASASTD